jgi:V/A-type H+-transporting ATPase subunit K
MDAITQMALAKAGAFAAIGLAAVGSALGCGAGGSAAVGAWKKCYAQNKKAPFLLTAFAGAPLSQTIYGMVMMSAVLGQLQADPKLAAYWPLFLVVGIIAGVSMGVSAWMQGKAAAGSCDAFAETGQGFANNIIALGIIETVAIFAMIFGMQVTNVAKVVEAAVK